MRWQIKTSIKISWIAFENAKLKLSDRFCWGVKFNKLSDGYEMAAPWTSGSERRDDKIGFITANMGHT